MPPIPEGLTLGLAITGSVLGVLNTWRAFDRDRIRVRVGVEIGIQDRGINGVVEIWGVTVVNAGFIPITIRQVGLRLRRGKQYVWIARPHLGPKLPHRMEARTSATFHAPTGTFQDPRLADALDAFAVTACGRTFRGTSAALKGLIRDRRAARKLRPRG